MTTKFEYLSDADVDQFLNLGYIVVKNAFSREKAAEWTKDIWHRLNLDPDNKAGWDRERIHMPSRSRENVADFAPKAWAAIKDLLGGEERIREDVRTWGDSFIVNLGADWLEKKPLDKRTKPQDLDNWHVDGDFFVHYLDSPEQALLVIPIFSDIKPNGGGTMIAPEGIDLVARYLAAHPEGVLPTDLSFSNNNKSDSGHGGDGAPQQQQQQWSLSHEIKKCKTFIEMTGETGDVVLLHPLTPHSASKNYLRVPRIITNPPVSVKKPFDFDRDLGEEGGYSLVERKTLRALGVDRFPFRITTERRRIVPARIQKQQVMLEEERKRLEAAK